MAEDTPIIAGYKLRNNLQSLLLMISLAALLATIGWLIVSNHGLALMLLGGFILLMSIRRFSPQHLLTRFDAQELTEEDAPELIDCIQRLSRDAGLSRPPRVYCGTQPSINAFTLKLHDEHIIVISHTLIKHLNEHETQAVLAHEISHIYHDDVSVMLVANRLALITRSLTILGMVMMAIMPMLSLQNITVPWQLIISLLLAYFVSRLLQLSLSRAREFYADIIAVQLTHDVPSMVSALKKIEQVNRNHWMNRIKTVSSTPLLQEHPSTQTRIRCLLGLEMLSGFTSPGHSEDRARQ